jgi:CubicO group peptidase (beta-lactamase class C family)
MKLKRKVTGFSHLITTLIAVIICVSPASASPTDTELQTRLERLSVELEKNRIELHIPGMAIAIVKDDKVIFAQGFGLRDVERNSPVTPQTLFAIGSSSKAFTATLIGMAVDKEEMQWDDPITQYIPYLKFALEHKTDQVTLRDMLSHRSGFSRNDLLWANGAASREEILRGAVRAEARSGFREKFNYNNVMFLGAGMANAKASGMDWGRLLKQRLLKPLGMKNTTTDYAAAQRKSNLALGYIWREEAGEFQRLPMRNLANIAPAGAINSNVLDMAQWLRFQLAGGVVEGHRLISAQQLQETRTAQIKVGKGVDYGLGWFLRQWRGQKVVEHAGSIDGFAAQVAMLPESNLGFVLLTNVTRTPLQQASINMVWEHLLGTMEQEKPPQDKKDASFYAEYVGEYHASFGPFKDEIIPFLIVDGKPAIDIPGQRVLSLEDPDDQGRWFFSLADTASISFDRNDQGKITAMRMHEGSMDFELPRKGVPIVAEVDLASLQPYLGTYQSSLFRGQITAKVQNSRLALDIPDEMVFELHLPDADSHRHFRVKPIMSAVFETDKSGKISAVSIYRGDKKLDTATRTKTNAEALPSVEDILNLRQTTKRKAALLRAGGVRINGTMTIAQAGVTGSIKYRYEGTERYRVDIDFGKMGKVRLASNEHGAARDGLQGFMKLTGKYREQMQKDHPAVDIDWRDFYDSIEVIKAGELDGKKVYMLRLKGGKTLPIILLLDAKTGDVLRRETRVLVPNVGSIKTRAEYSDYQDIHGLRFPFKTVSVNRIEGKTIIEYEAVETGLKFKPRLFKLKR